MARIFITGSADGLGSLAAQQLIAAGHSVVLHARNDERAADALKQAPGAEKVLVADLANIDAVKDLAEQVNALGEFDAVIHNAGVYSGAPEQIFAVNSVAPYLLTALINKPKHLIYVSSGMHKSGNAKLDDLEHDTTYGDSKFQIVLLTKFVARNWPDVYANAIDPGWVPTKMGGEGATDDLEEGYATQVWLASGADDANVTGQYFYHRQPADHKSETDDTELQDAYVARMQEITGVALA